MGCSGVNTVTGRYHNRSWDRTAAFGKDQGNFPVKSGQWDMAFRGRFRLNAAQ